MSFPFCLTGAALPPTQRADTRVEEVIPVALRALCLGRIVGRHSLTTQDILLRGNNFKVVYVDTERVAAEMIDLVATRHRTNKPLIEPAVGRDPPTVEPETAISHAPST